MFTGTSSPNVTDRAARLVGRVRVETSDTTIDSATIQQESIDIAGSGDLTAISSITGQTIRVWKLYFVVSGATNVQLKNGTATLKSGDMVMTASQGFAYDGDPNFPMFVSSGNAFIINSSVATAIAGEVWFTRVTE